MAWTDPIVAGVTLIRDAIRSPDYVTGVSGWTVNKDGTSEFDDTIIRGMITSGDLAGSHVIIDPNVSVGFNDGFLQAVIRMFPNDPNMMMEGMLGVVTFDALQVNAQMTTVLHSPVGPNRGFGIVLSADSDDNTEPAKGSMGTITVDGTAMTYVPVLDIETYGVDSPAFLSYGSASSEIIQSFGTGGVGSWVAPAGVSSVKVECWGGGGSGGAPSGTGGGGGGGGEYAMDPAVAVTPGNTYSRTVGFGSTSAANGGFSQFVGDSVTVKAFGGTTSNSRLGQPGGTGSTNATHHNGGAGGDGLSTGGGGGGGGSAGTTTVGGNGVNTSGVGGGGAGGSGGATGGGAGGHGGVVNGASGSTGGSPGGGGGGCGGGTSALSGDGKHGMIRLTYQSPPSTVAVSMAGIAGSDRFGNSYPAGFSVGANKVPDARAFQVVEGNASGALTLTTSFVDIPGDTITFTTINPNAKVAVTAVFDNKCTVVVAGALVLGQLIVDGVAPASGKQLIGSAAVVNRESNVQSWSVVLPAAGSHTIKMQGRVSAAATVQLQALHTCIVATVIDTFS